MKTTIELPDNLMRLAKITAAKRGTTLKALFTEILAREVAGVEQQADPPWKKFAGALSHLPKKAHAEIERQIAQTFEKIDEDLWK